MISIHDLRVDYDDLCAVSDLSLEIAPGEVYGLIGPNGAGKTSTMRALAGLLEPTYGEIRVAGVDIRDEPERARHQVGFMPDFPPMYEDLLAWEFLDLFAASYGVARGDRRATVEHYLERVGLQGKTNAPVGELSRGMRQRLMLAKTLLPEPSVLILDEPASGLDPNGRIELKRILRDLAGDGRSVLVSSHILTEMSEFCTSIGVMERGRLIVSGRVDEVTARVMGAETLAVEVLEGVERFLEIIGHEAKAGAPVRDEDTFELAFAGDRSEAGALLTRLTAAGVRIASFGRKKETLEDVFLHVGAKEVQ